MRLLLDAADTGERFEADLLEGNVSLVITDQRVTRATIAITGCASSSLGVINLWDCRPTGPCAGVAAIARNVRV